MREKIKRERMEDRKKERKLVRKGDCAARCDSKVAHGQPNLLYHPPWSL